MRDPKPTRLDRSKLRFLPVRERQSKFEIEALSIDPDAPPMDADPSIAGTAAEALIDRVAEEVIAARRRGAPVAICHGAHLIKNGLASVLIQLVEQGWLTHVATNGAGSIHDWEFGYLGRSCEDVRAYVAEGQFGLWQETGSFQGLALLTGVVDGLGYGASIGRLAVEEALEIPAAAELRGRIARQLDGAPGTEPCLAALADLLEAVERFELSPGRLDVPHPWSRYSVQAACYRRGVPFTVHPGVGQDIVYTHPHFHGGAVGRASVDDFLTYADMVRRLEGGVYLSVGSSVMSPMVFEKSVSMARNLARGPGAAGEPSPLDDFYVLVNDIAEATWDWSLGEPPQDNPAYYVRFCKSFSRMGGRLEYLGLDNRVFLTQLWSRLRELRAGG